MWQSFSAIFDGLEEAFGTYKIDKTQANGKLSGRAALVREPRTKDHWQGHLSGKGNSLGIIPINAENNCKWGCIDIDTYPFDHKKFILKLKEKNIPMIVCRSKSGGAHAFLFTKQFVPAAVMRAKLKLIASAMGFAGAEIFPKQDYIRVDRGDTGSFLNLPYHAHERTVRYAYGIEGNVLTLEEFFEVHENTALDEAKINELKIAADKEEKDDFKGMPPCLVTLLSDGVPDGQRNNCMYNVGVYLKKRHPDKDEWQGHMFTYNKQFMDPPLDASEINTLIGSLDSKDYQYKCKDEPIHSFCDAKKCALREFGVGDNAPTPEISEIRKYDSDPPIYFATIDGESVEVDDITLHDPEKFSLACMNQIGKPMMPVPKHMWRRLLIKLFATLETIPAPESSKLDVQLREILADYINKTPGKELKDVMRGIAFTDSDGFTYFKFKDFWKFLLKTKSWAEKTYPKQKTMRFLESLFDAEEASPKIKTKTVRMLKMPTIKLDRPNPRTTKVEKSPWL